MQQGNNHLVQLANDHLLVTMLIDVCSECDVATLSGALALAQPTQMCMSTELLDPCPAVYESERVEQTIHLEFDYGKPVVAAYNTSHIVSSTGKMTLASGYVEGYRHALIGLLHNKTGRFELEPIVIGAPWLDHPRNACDSMIMWVGRDYGEIIPEDIAEFSAMKSVQVSDADEWMDAMSKVPEAAVKHAIAKILNEPSRADWGGEENDHFSANVTVAGKRRTAAFLLKGPTKFQEMTPAMCGKNGDQIYRLAKCNADISFVQHAHLIGPAVRETVRAFTVRPGPSRKFCIMDGQATYRLLKAYDMLDT